MLALLTQLAMEAENSSEPVQEGGFPVTVLIIFIMLFIYAFSGTAFEHFGVMDSITQTP